MFKTELKAKENRSRKGPVFVIFDFSIRRRSEANTVAYCGCHAGCTWATEGETKEWTSEAQKRQLKCKKKDVRT